MSLAFQRGQSKGLEATYHFTFTGEEECKATVIIRDQTLQVLDGQAGSANLQIIADSRTWLRFVAKEANLAWVLLRRKIRIKGPARFIAGLRTVLSVVGQSRGTVRPSGQPKAKRAEFVGDAHACGCGFHLNRRRPMLVTGAKMELRTEKKKSLQGRDDISACFARSAESLLLTSSKGISSCRQPDQYRPQITLNPSFLPTSPPPSGFFFFETIRLHYIFEPAEFYVGAHHLIIFPWARKSYSFPNA